MKKMMTMALLASSLLGPSAAFCNTVRGKVGSVSVYSEISNRTMMRISLDTNEPFEGCAVTPSVLYLTRDVVTESSASGILSTLLAAKQSALEVKFDYRVSQTTGRCLLRGVRLP